MVMRRTLSDRKKRDIQARINCRLDLWEIRIHTGLVILRWWRSVQGKSMSSGTKKRRRIVWIAAFTAHCCLRS